MMMIAGSHRWGIIFSVRGTFAPPKPCYWPHLHEHHRDELDDDDVDDHHYKSDHDYEEKDNDIDYGGGGVRDCDNAYNVDGDD